MRHPFAERVEERPVVAELLAQLRHLGVGLVEFLHLAAQRVEVGAALAQRVHLPGRLLGELVHLAEPLVQRFEGELLAGQLVGLREQRVEPLGQQVELLRQIEQVLVLGAERVHSRLGVADRRLQRADALVEGLELLLADGQRVDLAADRVDEGASPP